MKIPLLVNKIIPIRNYDYNFIKIKKKWLNYIDIENTKMIKKH